MSEIKPAEVSAILKKQLADVDLDVALEEVGTVFHVTRERIRQIEAKALRRVRNPRLSKCLYNFLRE